MDDYTLNLSIEELHRLWAAVHNYSKDNFSDAIDVLDDEDTFMDYMFEQREILLLKNKLEALLNEKRMAG